MTTEEAKTKWCPMARCLGMWNKYRDGKSVGVEAAATFNRDSGSILPVASLCLAEGCACWINTVIDVSHEHALQGRCGLVR